MSKNDFNRSDDLADRLSEGAMSTEEAYEVLGLSPGAGWINHRRLVKGAKGVQVFGQQWIAKQVPHLGRDPLQPRVAPRARNVFATKHRDTTPEPDRPAGPDQRGLPPGFALRPAVEAHRDP